MSEKRRQVATTSESYGSLYYCEHLGCDEEYSWDSPHWRNFFTRVAERIIAVTAPARVLDVGCARGLLVQALVQQGIDAHGIDISVHAIDSSDPIIRDRLAVETADKVTGTWDLITCIEVVEHMSPADSEAALDSMCAATDRILISSSPGDFEEPTHVNVREPAAWAASFAERGFYRRTDVDLAFLTPWAVLFERANPTKRDIVYRYERWAYPMRVEVLDKRAALLAAHQALEDQYEATSDLGSAPETEEHVIQAELLRQEVESLRVELHAKEHQVLTTRDYAIGVEAETTRLRRDLDLATRAQHRELTAIRSSTSWKLGNALIRPVAALKSVLRRQ